MPEYDPFNPMDPSDYGGDGPTEFSWGAGLVPPNQNVDFGENYATQGLRSDPPTHDDIWAQAVAERRTDSTDPESMADLRELGNMDRYGKNPPLVRECEPSMESQAPEIEFNETPRGW